MGAKKGRLAQLVERFVYTEEVSQVRALYRLPDFAEGEICPERIKNTTKRSIFEEVRGSPSPAKMFAIRSHFLTLARDKIFFKNFEGEI